MKKLLSFLIIASLLFAPLLYADEVVYGYLIVTGEIYANGYHVAYVDKSGAYTLTINDDFVHCTGTFTITLPPLSTALDNNTAKKYYIKNESNGVITVDADGAETIDDETTQTLNEDDCMEIVAASDQWHII